MRIIDKNQDYYDYLQDYNDNVIVFDRRNSFLLTKEDMCKYFTGKIWGHELNNFKFVTLQCGGTFWLLLAKITKRANRKIDYYNTWNDYVTDYEFEVLETWKDYDVPNKLLEVKYIDEMAFPFYYKMVDRQADCIDYDKIKKNIDNLISAIVHNNIKEHCTTVISTKTYDGDYNNHKINRKCNIPLLKACGIACVIDAQELFCAIEEYFSIEKTKAERTEAIGTTNNDKITMHGFDTKTSFRGKVKA